jgi:hypothetical protein
MLGTSMQRAVSSVHADIKFTFVPNLSCLSFGQMCLFYSPVLSSKPHFKPQVCPA